MCLIDSYSSIIQVCAEPLVNTQTIENGIGDVHAVLSQHTPEPTENAVVESQEVASTVTVNSTENLEPKSAAPSVKNENVSPSKSSDTSTKNKLNLTIDIPKDEETASNNVQSATDQTPVEYDVKFEVRIFS